MTHRQRLFGRMARRLALRVIGLAAACSLAACASLWTPDAADADASIPSVGAAAAPAAAASGAGDSGAAYRLEVQAPGELRNLLRTYLDLGRFQGAADADRITAGELNRLVAAAPAQARSLLETEGYFHADVTTERLPAEGDVPLRVVVKVTPGARTRVERWTLDARGALKDLSQAGDQEARGTLELLRSRWPMQKGDVFRQPAWSSAKNGTLARLRSDGYPAANWASTTARVDARSNTATLDATVDSGPRFKLGELRIEGMSRYDESAVRNVADFGVGTTYTEKRLLDFQERLTKIGLFESVNVEIDPDPAVANATPVTVKVREQPLQQATTGIGYSDNTGPRITLEHRHRSPFGLDWQAHNKFEIGRDLRSWEGELISHPTPGQYRNLVAGSVSRLEAAGDTTVSQRARVGRLLETERIERLAFGEVLRSAVTNALGRRTSQAVSGNYHHVYRDVDSVLLPTDGWTASVETAAGYARSNYADSGPFGRVYARFTGYLPLGDSWFTTARIEGGQIISRQSIGLPDALLFRAGGDDSVRGYGYRTLGPTIDGVLTSGRSLVTGSAEIARPISPRMPALWWAAFIDAGNAANRWQDVDPAFGYGLGLRWRSPVGPLRVDLAYGQEVKKVRLHLSVGIAF